MTAEGTIDQNNCAARTLLKFYLDPLTEYQDIPNGPLFLREKLIIQNINRVEFSIIDVTAFNLLHNNFSLQLMLKPEAKRILPHILKKLQLNADQVKLMPYLMFQDKNCSSALKLAVKGKKLMIVNNLIEILIKTDQYGLLYSDQISPLLYKMKEQGIDLKPLFQSTILFHKVDNKNPNFPEYNPKLKYCITHSNALCLQDVLHKEQQKFLIEEKEDRLAFKIEYYIVNMKDQINNVEINKGDKKRKIRQGISIIQLIDELSDVDLTYLDIQILQIIIKFKWDKYTYKYFLIQFLQWLLFIAVFILDLVFGNFDYAIDNEIGFFIPRGICQIILLRFVYYEIYQLTIEKCEYFSSAWNISELTLHLIFPFYLFVSFYYKSQLYLIKSIQSVIILLAFLKFLFLLRIFQRFSFIIQMVETVFKDLRSFLYFFAIVVVFFTVFLGNILIDLSNYEGIGSVGYFVIALRESVGDYDTDSYSKTDYRIIGWIVYLMVMFLGNVIFMNFIIAVVSQSYENCMQKSQAQSFKVKLNMIRELETIMTENDYLNQERFPNFILLCKPLSEGNNIEGEEMENGWNGLLKEMDKGVQRQFELTNQQHKKIMSSIESDIKILESNLTTEITETKEKIFQLSIRMEEQNKVINKLLQEQKVLLTKISNYFQ